MNKAQLVNLVLAMAREKAFRVETNREGLTQIDFGSKKLHAKGLDATFLEILEEIASPSKTNERVASDRACNIETFHFDDNEASANELAKLVLDRKKRATASLLWTYESEKKRIPEAGDLSIVTDFRGAEVCVIETTQVDIVAFSDVSDEFAATEGEGDGSLAYWRRAHEAFFGRECQRIRRKPAPNMPVVCERFEVVFTFEAATDA